MASAVKSVKKGVEIQVSMGEGHDCCLRVITVGLPETVTLEQVWRM